MDVVHILKTLTSIISDARFILSKGKTTILRAVVGRLTVDSGTVEVFGKEPGSEGHKVPGSLIGYMPQVN